jgi:hypothetical protein
MSWIAPSLNGSAAPALAARDGRRLRLAPDEEVQLSFPLPDEPGAETSLRFALRMFGYYEFLQER